MIVLLLNAIVALLYLGCSLLFGKKRYKGVGFRTLVMFLCPVVGPCFFLLSYIFYRLFFYGPVPLEEAIEVTDTEELRSLMMNVVRGDIRKSLASISLALNSQDTETAHYAASVLQDALNDFRMNVQKQYQLVMEEGEKQVAYAEILVQHVFTDMEQRNYVEMMDQVCEILYAKERSRMTSSRYEAVTLRLLELEEFDECVKRCDRAAYQYPNSLATYTCQLKLYFNSGQKRRFFQVIEELKQSSVVIDSETLELIRVFM